MSPRLLFFSQAPFHVPCSLPSCDHTFNSLRIKGRTSLQVVAELNVLNARRMPCEANFGTLCSTFLESAPPVSHSPWRGHGRVPSSNPVLVGIHQQPHHRCCIEGCWNFLSSRSISLRAYAKAQAGLWPRHPRNRRLLEALRGTSCHCPRSMLCHHVTRD